MAKKWALVQCVVKDDRYNPYERISHLGGLMPSQWRLTQSDVIDYIKAGECDFYVERPAGERVKVEVRTSRYGNDYIRTEADADEPNNLLSLPRCL